MRLDLGTSGAEVRARTAGRLVAAELGLAAGEQTRTAVLGSELARVGRSGGLEWLSLRVVDGAIVWALPAAAAFEPSWSGLADAIVRHDDELRVSKHLAGGQPADPRLSELRARLLTADPEGLAEEVRRQNAELSEVLARQQETEAALHKSRRRLALALDAAQIGTWEHHVDDGWRLSERAQQILGLPPDEHELPLALPERRRGTVQRALQAARTGTRDLDLSKMTLHGAAVELHAVLDGDTLVGTVHDVTERMRRERDLESRAELRQRLMGMASHDLRNPLAVLRSGLEVLANQPELEGEPVAAVRQRMESACDAASEMIRAMLDLTEAELGGGLRLDRRPASLNDLVEVVADQVRFAKPEATITTSHADDCIVSIDTSRMRQVAANLIENAVKHTTGPIRVHTSEAGDVVRFEVTNPGTDIPPAEQARIFEPMARGRQSRDRGLGLGLYIVREIVVGHGGNVEVRSGDGTTTFVVELPKREPAQ